VRAGVEGCAWAGRGSGRDIEEEAARGEEEKRGTALASLAKMKLLLVFKFRNWMVAASTFVAFASECSYVITALGETTAIETELSIVLLTKKVL
jgi:hypothetical protein